MTPAIPGVVPAANGLPKGFGAAPGLLGLLQRIKSVEDNAWWCDWILERKRHFVGMDLADDEVAFPASPFAPLFQKAKAQGLGITVHAGEPNVKGAARNILVALDELGADRIGHGNSTRSSAEQGNGQIELLGIG